MQASRTGYKVDKTSKCVINYGPCTVESENREFATKTVVRPIFHIFSLMFVHADGCFALCVSQFTQFRTPISHPFFANYRFAFRRLLIAFQSTLNYRIVLHKFERWKIPINTRPYNADLIVIYLTKHSLHKKIITQFRTGGWISQQPAATRSRTTIESQIQRAHAYCCTCAKYRSAPDFARHRKKNSESHARAWCVAVNTGLALLRSLWKLTSLKLIVRTMRWYHTTKTAKIFWVTLDVAYIFAYNRGFSGSGYWMTPNKFYRDQPPLPRQRNLGQNRL